MPDFSDPVFLVCRRICPSGIYEYIPHSVYGDIEYAQDFVEECKGLYPGEEFFVMNHSLPFYPA